MSQSRFAAVTQAFSPAWFAAIMGTAVVPLALSFLNHGAVRPLAGFFILLAAAMFLLALGPWLFKFFWFPGEIRRDLNHPIASNFYPTMPISLVLFSLDLLKYPDMFFDVDVSRKLAWVLWLAGSAGIYFFGFVILIHIFRHREINLGHATFGWFIPPVSKLVIPVAGLELAHVLPANAESAFLLSMVSLGVGFFLFLFVGAAVYHRYVYHELPMNRFAATFFIGIAPTAILAVILFKLMHLVKAGVIQGLDFTVVATFARLGILMNWGLSLWWFVMALIVVAYYIRKITLPYALSWWAFTFPTGALVVATGVAWKVTGFAAVHTIYLLTLVFLLAVWLVVFLKTLRGVFSGALFKPSH